jgi:hypothetical protein
VWVYRFGVDVDAIDRARDLPVSDQPNVLCKKLPFARHHLIQE